MCIYKIQSLIMNILFLNLVMINEFVLKSFHFYDNLTIINRIQNQGDIDKWKINLI